MYRLSFLGIYLLLFQVVLGQSPHGEEFTRDCNDCHTSKNWSELRKDLNFNHRSTGFELMGQHSQIDCKSCHDTLVFSQAPVNCNECHLDMHSNSLGQDCERCHTSESWIVNSINELHDMSRFPLSGAHQTASCMECHETFDQLRFEVTGIECIDCHRQDYLSTRSPNHQENGYSFKCEECHGMSYIGWTGADFNHHFFPLTGGHSISCTECHTSGSFEKLSTECYSCHQQDFEGADNPNHISLGFSQDCNSCHTIQPDWEPAKFTDHDAVSFPIYSGEHKGEWNSCSECHTQPNDYSVYTCIDCHEHNQKDMDSEHRGTVGYSYTSTSCYACHPTGNEGSSFNHNTTAFPLTGEHTTVDCASCHTQGYAGTSTECNACHNDDFMSAQEPNHVNAGIHLQCQDCHTSSGWSPSQFNHATTGFELSGGHAQINQCSECHIGSLENTSPECISCHQEDYNTAEGHLANNYSTNCLQCHATGSWDNAEFDHNTTAFPLTGEHTTVDCTSCHTQGYAGTSTECNACHNDDFMSAQEPNHVNAGIHLQCQDCHTSSGWSPSQFNHATTGFELSGGHAQINQCSECHIGSLENTSPECISCHQEDYNTAEGHLANNYPTNCLQCHATGSWDNAEFDHNTTAFPLTGEHTTVDCTSCHTQGYAGTSTECNACHNDDFNQSANPNHQTLGIPVNCEECHTTNPDWQPATFNIHDDYYALTGAHASIRNNCAVCHNGDYNNTANTCYECHVSEYNNSVDPDHQAAGFPVECESCHSQSSWEPATFDHDSQYFPIYSGEHRGEWNSCSDCHTQTNNFALFSCIDCHEHNQSEMNSEHDDVSGYAYNSASCLSCHPDGRED